MPLSDKLQCSKCDNTESLMWHRSERGIVCNDCSESDKSIPKVEEEELSQSKTSEKPKAPTRKSTKSTPNYKTRQNSSVLPKQVALKGKGKRSIFKKNPPVKLQRSSDSFKIVNSVQHEGTVFTIGDIVSVQDIEGEFYYAQIKQLMVDQFCEKSASITWLIPTHNGPLPFVKGGFDPLTYVMGPHDDLPRKLECFHFVMKAPSDYFKGNSPFPSGMESTGPGHIWTRLRQ
uniref:GATA zinc finger domain-containing protein 1 n=1 Tax=Graphocephala atropunctata TaxID=36148 RepID=A0A1B6KFZ6_9HEMI